MITKKHNVSKQCFRYFVPSSNFAVPKTYLDNQVNKIKLLSALKVPDVDDGDYDYDYDC